MSNRGAIQTLGGQPVDATQVQPYDKPEKPVIIQGVNPQDQTPTAFRVNPSGGPAQPIEGFQGKSSAAGAGQTRLPERTQQLGLALNAAAETLPFHDEAKVSPPGLTSGWLGQKGQEGSQVARGILNVTNPKYENYIGGMNGALLAVAHSVGGARINKEQVNMFGGNMMVSPNDPPETIDRKTRAIVDFMNAARTTLPPEAVAGQEAQMKPEALAFLRSKGYGNMPTAAGMAKLQQVRELGGVTEGGAPSPITPAATSGGPTKDEWAKLNATDRLYWTRKGMAPQ